MWEHVIVLTDFGKCLASCSGRHGTEKLAGYCKIGAVMHNLNRKRQRCLQSGFGNGKEMFVVWQKVHLDIDVLCCLVADSKNEDMVDGLKWKHAACVTGMKILAALTAQFGQDELWAMLGKLKQDNVEKSENYGFQDAVGGGAGNQGDPAFLGFQDRVLQKYFRLRPGKELDFIDNFANVALFQVQETTRFWELIISNSKDRSQEKTVLGRYFASSCAHGCFKSFREAFSKEWDQIQSNASDATEFLPIELQPNIFVRILKYESLCLIGLGEPTGFDTDHLHSLVFVNSKDEEQRQATKI